MLRLGLAVAKCFCLILLWKYKYKLITYFKNDVAFNLPAVLCGSGVYYNKKIIFSIKLFANHIVV